jgi:plasmid stabilization system protein ParE
VKLVISREAAADLDRLYGFLSDKNAAAAQRAIGALVKAIHSLEVFPERGRPSGTAGVREFVVPFGRSAYLLRYVHSGEADELVILRVWHGREDTDRFA